MKDETLDLPAFLPYQLSVASNRVSAEIARLYADRFGLTIPEWRMMAILGRFPGLSANEVAERAAMDKVQVSRAVARMISSGLLDRTLSPDDRRRSALQLSDNGLNIYRQIVPLAKSYERRIAERLEPDERKALSSALIKLAKAAE
ncbi:MarR family winged helix-turn-helix transcriptional regulator [Minwuia sp.]|uniref:MarR family winged helix-turn-helix transcriptional regulator n=1 Tax=Minwuia sp. TaxID=2493630 RepID=UPI003A93D973